MIPVFDVTGLGIVDPEYFSIKLLWEQSSAVQLERVTKSHEYSVEKELNCKETEVAPLGAMIPDMISLLP